METEGLAVNLRGTVEAVIVSKLHPRSGISVTIQETSTDGALFAAAVNAAALALSDAGVPLKSLCTAATVALMGDDRFVLDPNAAEEEVGFVLVGVFFFVCVCGGWWPVSAAIADSGLSRCL